MKHFRRFALSMLLTSMVGSPIFAQDQEPFNLDKMLNFGAMLTLNAEREKEMKQARAKEVMQDNEYVYTGYEEGIFFCNPLVLDGEPLDYGDFNLLATGELTVSKGVARGQTTQIPFYVYLRRDGNKVLIPGKELPDPGQIKIDIAEILRYAEPGDHLVIEAVRREDGPAKRILKLLEPGC
ncbi:MAG TPA: hypothetical protein VFW11_20145 [Cyclobacteriaceae bacterium]|nr:hypothetical protein [Cyclobacteriaceae bacterium]